jgi:GAF domain-containing protein
MLAWIKRLLAAPVFADEEKTRVARLLNTILLVVFALVVAYGIFSLATDPSLISAVTYGAIVLLALGLLLLLRRGHVRLASFVLSATLWTVLTAGTYLSGGLRGSGASSFFGLVLIAGLLLGGRAGLGFAGLSIAAALGMLYAEINGRLPPSDVVITPFSAWMEFTITLLGVAGLLYLATRGISETLERAQRNERAQVEANRELQAIRESLEQRVADRTRDLERQAGQLRAASEVARDATAARDLDDLLNRAVNLIRDRLGFYHTGLFLLDAASEYAVLRTASSEGGQRMLARGHKLPVGQTGVVGDVAQTGQPRIALDVGRDAVLFDNPDLPRTRSEMALPLKVRERVIGVLDVQSLEAAAFSEEDVAVLQTLADQVALAIENTRLLAEAQARLQEISGLLGRSSREGWAQLAAERPDWGYLYDGGEVRPHAAALAAESQVTVPLQVRGETVGHLGLALADRRPLTAEEIALTQAVIEQASLALESARLYQDTQRRAAREQLLGEISSQMQRAVDMESLMRITAEEVSRGLGGSRTYVRLNMESPLRPPDRGEQKDEENR